MKDLLQFHNLAHVFISLTGAILLLAIYYTIKSRYLELIQEDNHHKRVDKGLLYLSLAMFVWVLSGISAYFAITQNVENTLGYQVLTHLLSISNNMFLLLALSYFAYAPTFIYRNNKNVITIIVIIALITFSTLLVSYVFGSSQYNMININALPDLLLSGFLSYLLAYSLFKTFSARKMQLVAGLSIIIIFLVFYSQLPEVFTYLNDDFTNNLIKIIAKTSLISIFLVLATSWVIQLANTPKADEIKLSILDWSIIRLNIPSKNIQNQTLDFGSKTTQFRNLLKFSLRRKFGNDEDQYIEVGNYGEIKNQTYLTRIIDNMNELLPDEKSLERNDLFIFIGNGKYRLRILPENILIDESLQNEFIQTAKNEIYKKISR